MTNEEWKAVEEELSHCPFGRAVLLADGYELTITFCRDGKSGLKFCYVVYVNGQIKGEWVINDCEERRRFYCAKKRTLLSAKDKARLKKEKKSVQKAVTSEMSYVAYLPYWNSVRALKKHLEANNQNISIKSLGCERRGSDG